MTTYWACAQTHLHDEALALRNLRRQKYHAWYPFFLVPNRFHHLAVKPCFPNYVFIEVDDEYPNWSPINSTLGIKRLLTEFSKGDYRKPARAIFIDGMRKLRGDRDSAVSNLLPPGTTVRIKRGPFAERVALVELSDGDRVKLLLEVFSREISVEFSLDDVQLVRRPVEGDYVSA
jgi:transcription antitermination factor NusG